MKKKSEIISIIIILIITLLTGCSNSREFEDLAIVSAIALDVADDPKKIKITSQTIDMNKVGSAATKAGGDKRPYKNISIVADTIFAGLRKSTFMVNRKLYFPHMKVLILGEELAKRGFAKYLDIFARDLEFRNTIWVLIAKGKASDILEVEPVMGQINGFYLSDLVKSSFSTSQVPAITFQEVTKRILSSSTAPIATYIAVDDDKEEVKLKGTAVFKDDKLIGMLNHRETRGLLWILNQIESGIITINNLDKSKVSLEIINSNTKVTPLLKDNQLIMKIKVDEIAHIGGQVGTTDLSEKINLINKRNTTIIHNEIEAALKKAKNLKADVFLFGDNIYHKYPKEWKNIEDNWEILFPKIKTEITVKTKLQRAGAIRQGLKAEGTY